ncbi:MAG: CsgG/HfaB family protein [Planctomycetota bacterium]|jgi:curli biogenesis system outer membrane secretion channel CsgG
MRTALLVVLGVICCTVTGCQQIESFLNPSPTTEGSRVAEKLRDIPPPNPAKVKTVTVYRFQNKTGFPHGLAISNGMTDQLITALVKTRHFDVVERAELGDVMEEKHLQASGAAKGQAGKTKLAGAELIFAGSVTELDETGGGGVGLGHWGVGVDVRTATAQVGLDMRIIDAGTGRILDSIDVRRKVRRTGVTAGHTWGISGGVNITNALDLAIRETLDEAVYQLVTRFGAN